MALTWDATAIGHKPNTGVFNDKNGEWRRTDYLCFMLMAVDMREVTKKNWKEVYGRIRMYEKLFGSAFTKPCKHRTKVEDVLDAKGERIPDTWSSDKDYQFKRKTVYPNCKGHITDGVTSSRVGNIPAPYTAKQIKDRIGYSTNVSSKNKSGFLSHLWKSWGYEYKDDLKAVQAEVSKL